MHPLMRRWEVTCQDCWITACGYSAVLVHNMHVDLQPPRLWGSSWETVRLGFFFPWAWSPGRDLWMQNQEFLQYIVFKSTWVLYTDVLAHCSLVCHVDCYLQSESVITALPNDCFQWVMNRSSQQVRKFINLSSCNLGKQAKYLGIPVSLQFQTVNSNNSSVAKST